MDQSQPVVPPRKKRLPVKTATRYERFCQEYLKDFNGTQAAVRTGYAAPAAKVQASQLLTNPNVQDRLRELQKQHAEKTELTIETIIRELLVIARVDIAAAYDEQGQLKPIHEIPESIRRAIAGIEVVEEFAGRGADREQIGWTKKLRFWDKNKALELLGKHLDIFAERPQSPGVTIINVQKQVIEAPHVD